MFPRMILLVERSAFAETDPSPGFAKAKPPSPARGEGALRMRRELLH
ncbi:hypothetical protein BF49_4076 [Bradyrhizobium sp.]|nr:hypothetical protein BF49_4076 [Bradyrhizobium sp.]